MHTSLRERMECGLGTVLSRFYWIPSHFIPKEMDVLERTLGSEPRSLGSSTPTNNSL